MSLAITGEVEDAEVLGVFLVGHFFRTILPNQNFSSESKDVMTLGMGLIGTMSALVLSLLISSAKGSYDTRSSEVVQLSANITLLDRLLAHYGPEARDTRDVLRVALARITDQTWPSPGPDPSPPMPTARSEVPCAKLQPPRR